MALIKPTEPTDARQPVDEPTEEEFVFPISSAEDPLMVPPMSSVPMSPTSVPGSSPVRSLLDLPEVERGNILRVKRRRQKTTKPDRPIVETPTPKDNTPPPEAPRSEAPPPEALHANLQEEAEEIPAAKRLHTEPPLDPPPSPAASPRLQGASSSATLWPDDEGNFPIGIFNNFILPGDDRVFEGLNQRELANYNALHLSRVCLLNSL